MSAKENSTCQNLIFEAIDRAKGSKSVGPLHFYYLWRVDARKDKSKVKVWP